MKWGSSTSDCEYFFNLGFGGIDFKHLMTIYKVEDNYLHLYFGGRE